MKIEEFELMESLLPKGSLWKISEFTPSASNEYFAILFEYDKIKFHIQIGLDLKIRMLSANLSQKQMEHEEVLLVNDDFAGFYASLDSSFREENYGWFTDTTVKKTLKFLEETGGPNFFRTRPFASFSLRKQSESNFKPTPCKIKIRAADEN